MIDVKNNTKNVDFVILVPGKTFSKNFLSSWTQTIDFLVKENYTFVYAFLHTPIIDHSRNLLFSVDFTDYNSNQYTMSTLLFNDSIKCKKVIMIDSDMVWNTEAFKKLISSKEKVIMAPYVLSDKEHVSIVKDGRFITLEEVYKYSEVTECDGGGLGFTACDFNVLKDLKFPWFKTDLSVQGKEVKRCGEDVYFFNKVSEAGHKIYFDLSIIIGHEKSEIWGIG